MWRGPGVGEDAKNVALIGASAMVAVVLTAGFLGANASPERVHVVRHVVETSPAPDLSYEMVEPLSGTNRLYGTVHTRSGEELTGFLRWDRNEGSWTDLLDATKFEDGRARSASGIRFGHVRTIEVVGRDMAVFTLRSGQQVGMTSRSTDLGPGLRALTVTQPDGRTAQLAWRELRQVDFRGVPRNTNPPEGRLHGTLTTRSGLELTGFITWDVDEIYTTDMLDGDAHGRDYEIPFGAVRSIDRESSRSARVALHSGEEIVLDGSNDVDRRNRGISVSDPALGQVLVEWDAFARVEFHGTPDESSIDAFDGGRELTGTVVTESGDELSGRIRWDRDEAHSWELLNAENRDGAFQIEFGHIATIEKSSRGATVALRDGRTFDLYGSNDVNRENRGILVESGGSTYTVDWDEFREVRFDG